MSQPGTIVQTALLYCAAFWERVSCCIVLGAGKIRAALFYLRGAVYGKTAYPVPILALPPEILLFGLGGRLKAGEILALTRTCSGIRNCYSDAQISSLVLEKNCIALLKTGRSGSQDDRIGKAYQQVLMKLFDPEAGRHELQHLAVLTGKFYRALSKAEIRMHLNCVLSQPQTHLQAQLEKLARVDLELCASLCGIATLGWLTHNGVTDWGFLVDRLAKDRTRAYAFLDSMGRTPHDSALRYAVEEGFVPIASALLKASPHCVDQVNFLGYTLLQGAIYKGNAEMVELLLTWGHNANALDFLHQTPIIKVASSVRIGNTRQIAQILLRHGADIEVRGKDAYTALMHACLHKNTGVAQLLLEYGAKTDVKNDHGTDACAIARAMGAHDIMQLLESPRGPA